MRADHGPPQRKMSMQHGLHDAPVRVSYQQLNAPVPLHWHEFYEIGFIVAGEGTHVRNGDAHRLSGGTVLLLTPADFHELIPDAGRPLELFNVIFAAEQLDEEVQRLLFGLPSRVATVVAGQGCGEMEADFRRLREEERAPRLAGRSAMRATLHRILIDTIRAAESDWATAAVSAATEQQRRLGTALLYLHHHFRQALTLADVARQAHLSPNYFSERFRAATGTPFQRYMQDLRLGFARSLLAVSDLSVTEVCYAAGFNTLSHFERAFKRQYGCSPRACREMALR